MGDGTRTLLLSLLGLALAAALFGANYLFRQALWNSLLNEAATISQYFADQASLALSFHDVVALGWAVRRAVMAEVLYAQVVTDGEVRAQDAVANLSGLELGLEPPSEELEFRRLRLPSWGDILDVKRRLYGRGKEANTLLGYVRMGISARRVSSLCATFAWATSLGGAALFALFLFLAAPRRASSSFGKEGSGGSIPPSGALVIDDERKEVLVRGSPVNLSPKEYELLRLLAASPGKVFSPREIRDRVWPEGVISLEEVKRYIYLLRRKIEEDPRRPRHIVTVKGFGYKFEP